MRFAKLKDHGQRLRNLLAFSLSGAVCVVFFQNCSGSFNTLPGSNESSLGSVVSTPTTAQYPDGSRRVWLHQMIQLPTYQISTPYGAEYPLALRATYSSPLRAQDTPSLFLNAGITGVQLLVAEGLDQTGHMSDAMKNYDGTALTFAPVLAITTQAGGIALIDSYLAIAKTHTSAATIVVKGQQKYIISFYGARYGFPAQFWVDFRTALGTRPVYLLGDIETAVSYDGGVLRPDVIDPFATASLRSYLNLFDASWTFDELDLDWPDVTKLFATATSPFAGGMLPAYNRESVSYGGYSDAEATAKYRRQWTDAVSSDLQWNTVVSWNDVAERHDIWPSSEWNYTRSDITAFYSALTRRVAFSGNIATPQLYATVPQRMNADGTQMYFEALLLNTSTAPMTVQAQLVDAAGALIGSAMTTSVAGSTAGAVTLRPSYTQVPAGNFVRMKATSFSSNGSIVQTVLSAPVLIYAAGEQTSSYMDTRTKYHSIPARMALPGKVTLMITGNPTSGSAKGLVAAPSGTSIRFADVLQNTYLANSQMDPSTPVAANLPMVNGVMNATSIAPTTPASGFYLARVIDQNERVGYSDPIYFKP